MWKCTFGIRRQLMSALDNEKPKELEQPHTFFCLRRESGLWGKTWQTTSPHLVLLRGLREDGSSFSPFVVLVCFQGPEQNLIQVVITNQDLQRSLCLSWELVAEKQTERTLLGSHYRAQELCTLMLSLRTRLQVQEAAIICNGWRLRRRLMRKVRE